MSMRRQTRSTGSRGAPPGRFQVQPLPGRRVANDLLRMTAPHEHVPDTATPILGAAAITALA
jgi:hypothetical protein